MSSTQPITATIALSQIQFQPWSPGNYTTAQFTLIGEVPGVTLEGENITVAVPPDQTVYLAFQLADPDYVLLGIAFNPGESDVSRGRKEFPLVTVQRSVQNSQLTVMDKSMALFYNVNFAYVILLQEVSSGLIGVIDPDIINEPEN